MESQNYSIATSKIKKIIVHVFQTKASRGSSYIPTPENYKHAQCGLVNIQSDAEKCFYWCMKYQSSSKDKHADIPSVLKQLEDKAKRVIVANQHI